MKQQSLFTDPHTPRILSNLPKVAISIKQPWATLIIHANKDIENRSWYTKFRGPVLIHASKKKDDNEMLAFQDLKAMHSIDVRWFHGDPIAWKDAPCGGIIGITEIVDCVQRSTSPWFVGDHGFVLRNSRPLPFFPCRGQLGFWRHEYPDELWQKAFNQ